MSCIKQGTEYVARNKLCLQGAQGCREERRGAPQIYNFKSEVYFSISTQVIIFYLFIFRTTLETLLGLQATEEHCEEDHTYAIS